MDNPKKHSHLSYRDSGRSIDLMSCALILYVHSSHLLKKWYRVNPLKFEAKLKQFGRSDKTELPPVLDMIDFLFIKFDLSST